MFELALNSNEGTVAPVNRYVGGAVAKPKGRFDEIGAWSEIKLEIVKKYAAAYSRIFAKQPTMTHHYIDGFAGSGVHVSKATRRPVSGSPLNALAVEPPFKSYTLIDITGGRVRQLRKLIGERDDVRVLEGDCNELLLHDVFPDFKYISRRRALCLLDPYGLHLDWDVMAKAGQLRTIDLFLNFPIMDINRNALWSKPELVTAEQARPLTRFWGDESWQSAAYELSAQEQLFGEADLEKKSNAAVVAAFRNRLRAVAGFKFVPDPLPMRNSTNAVIYYLFFASQNETGARIATDIFRRYAAGVPKMRGERG